MANFFREISKDYEQHILMGKSFGCATSIYLAINYKGMFHKIILESGFTSAQATVKYNCDERIPCKLGCLIPLCCTISWRSIDRIDKVEEPILFITGIEDRIVPAFMSHELKAKATSATYTELFEIEGLGHNGLWKKHEGYWERVEKYLQRE